MEILTCKSKLALSSMFSLAVCLSAAATVAAESPKDSLKSAEQAITLSQENKFDEALTLETDILKSDPNDSSAHAMVSYLNWQQGNILGAVAEGEKAVELSPKNTTLLTNLAQIKEGLDDCKGALPLFEDASKLAADNWVAALGQARCQIKTGKPEIGIALLEKMVQANNRSFDWYYELADTCLRTEKPLLAESAARKAIKFASTPENKSKASVLLFLALLRTDKVELAGKMTNDVMTKYHSDVQEVYVRAASALSTPEQPGLGKEILDAAIENLKRSDDGDGFFKIGRVFEEKAKLAQHNATKSNDWLKLAESAYKQAIALDNYPGLDHSRYHLALAGIMESQGRQNEMIDELKTAKGMNRFSPLPDYLLSRFTVADKSEVNSKDKTQIAQESSAKVQDSTANTTALKDLNLTKVQFKIEGLNCGCQISRVEESIKNIDGVAFVFIPANITPFQGTMLVNQSIAPVASVFSQSTKAVAALYAGMKTPIVPFFSTLSEDKVEGTEDAVSIAQNTEFGRTVSFYNAFKPVFLALPTQAIAQSSKKGTY